MIQQTIWNAPEVAVGATTAERWATVKEANPKLVGDFWDMAREAIERGHKRIGVKWLVEIYRWERSGLLKVGDDKFKWNNNWTSHLARDLIKYDPKLADYIEIREKKK